MGPAELGAEGVGGQWGGQCGLGTGTLLDFQSFLFRSPFSHAVSPGQVNGVRPFTRC